MRVQVVSSVDALLTVEETVSMFDLAFSSDAVMPDTTAFIERRDASSRRSASSWAARASSSDSGGGAGDDFCDDFFDSSACFTCCGRLLGTEGEAKRSSVSEKVSERESESRFAGLSSPAIEAGLIFTERKNSCDRFPDRLDK